MSRLSEYELTVILKSSLSEDHEKAIHDRIQSVAKEFGGEVLQSESWGRRRLAYPIQKETKGLYLYFVLSGKTGVSAEIERHLRISEDVLRFLTVVRERDFDPAQFKKQPAPLAPSYSAPSSN